MVLLFQSHLSGRQHLNCQMTIEDFASHCRGRNISPTDCGIDDIIFYFDLVYPKTKHGQLKVTIHQVPIYAEEEVGGIFVLDPIFSNFG